MNKDKLRNIISKKSKGDNTLSGQFRDIREEDEYGGFKINIMATMDNLKIHLAVEITTGDKITPREINYNYNSIFEDKKISILAYTTETIIAEKYHTVIV